MYFRYISSSTSSSRLKNPLPRYQKRVSGHALDFAIYFYIRFGCIGSTLRSVSRPRIASRFNLDKNSLVGV